MVNFNEARKPLLPIYFVHWIFGMGVLEYPIGKPHPTFSIFYSSCWVLLYCTLAALSYPDVIRLGTDSVDHTSVKIIFFSQILIAVITIAVNWMKCTDLHPCVIRSTVVDKLMFEIGIKKDYSELLKIQLGKLLCGALIVLCLIVINIVDILSQDIASKTKILMSIVMSYPILLMFITESTFINIVSRQSYRFKELNKLLKKMDSTSRVHSYTRKINDLSQLYINKVDPSSFEKYSTVVSTSKQIHLHVIEMCQTIDNAYGLQILTSVIVAFGVITGNLYLLYQIIFVLKMSRNYYATIIISSIWIIYYIIKINIFTMVCNDCVQESLKTGDIISRLYDDPTVDDETQKEIRNFNVQMIQKPLRFSAYGFIDIDYSLIQGMISSITTYLMILIQLGKLPSSINFRGS